jgi:hypothetical protein
LAAGACAFEVVVDCGDITALATEEAVGLLRRSAVELASDAFFVGVGSAGAELRERARDDAVGAYRPEDGVLGRAGDTVEEGVFGRDGVFARAGVGDFAAAAERVDAEVDPPVC